MPASSTDSPCRSNPSSRAMRRASPSAPRASSPRCTAMVWFGMQVSGSDADARMPLLAGGGTLLALGALAIVQQNRSKVVVRTDGVERWGLRGKIWALRWAEMIELRYRAVKMRVYHVIPAGTNIYVTLTDPQGK